MKRIIFVTTLVIGIFTGFAAISAYAQDAFIREYIYDKSHSQEGLKGEEKSKEDWFLMIKDDETAILTSKISGKTKTVRQGVWEWSFGSLFVEFPKNKKETALSYRFEITDNAYYLALENVVIGTKETEPAKRRIFRANSPGQKAYIREPISAKGYIYRAEGCGGETDCKIKNYDKALAFEPKNALLYKLRGDIYRDKKNYQQAANDYAEAIKLNPNFGEAYLSLAEFSKPEEAISNLTEYLKIKPEDDRAYSRRGGVYIKLEDYEKGISDYTTAIKLNPAEGHYYLSRANTYKSLSKYELAISDYSKAMETSYWLETLSFIAHPIKALYYSNRAECYGKIGKYENAASDYTKAIEIRGNISRFYKERAEMYEKLGELEKAKADFKKYDELNSK